MTDTINEIVGYDPYQMVTVMVGGRYDSVPQSISVADISSKLTRLVTLENRDNSNIAARIKLEDYLKENIDSLDDHAHEIAKIFGIELMREVTATVTFTITATLEIPFGYEVDEDDFQIDISESVGDVNILNWSVDTSECYVDEVS